jgi:DNA-binding NarL/FixJ family response regulator
MSSSRADVVSIIEAAYRVDTTPHEWLSGVLEAARPSLDGGAGMDALIYDASNPSRMRLLDAAFYDPLVPITKDMVAQIIETADPDFVRDSWRSLACALSSTIPGIERQPGWGMLRSMGIVDTMCVNGIDASGIGCEIIVNHKRPVDLTARARRKWSRVAAHLAAGLRLHRRLGEASARRDLANGADAVLAAHGRVEHAEHDAKLGDAREALERAAVAMDRARGSMRRMLPDDAVAEWKGLIAARWSLVDHFDTDGKHYLVARRNGPEARGLGALTERERQVAAAASLGRSNKLIAYELGIADSTVRVLVARAMAKLGVASRKELVEQVARALEAAD